MIRFPILLLAMLLACSCVSQRKFNSLRAELVSAQSRLDHSRSLLTEYSDRSEQLGRLNQQQQSEIAALREKQADLQARYDLLMVTGSDDTSRLREQLDANSARLAELERLLVAREQSLAEIRRKVAAALTGFDGKGLSITSRDGKVYVSMDDKLLFRSGSFEIDDNGARAVRDLAAVLAANPDIDIMVEGHTDDVPYRGTGNLQDNLDLSAKRATTVTRMLLENKDIDPARIVTAGRGEWLPVTLGTSPEARGKNRRTEIILTPKLDELFQLLDK